MTRGIILAAALLLASTSFAQVPPKVGYQGRLLMADGSPESGSHKLTFTLFDAATAGSPLWTEDQTLALSDGYYSAVLGDVTPLDLTAFNGSERFLEIAVDNVALSPRQRIDAVPYALVATNLKGGTVEATSVDSSSFKVGGNTVIDSTGKLIGSAAYSAAPGSGLSVTGNTIALSSQGCVSGQVLTWTNNAWACANPGQTYTAGSGVLLNNNSFSVDPANNSFVQNQSAAAQNASFRVGGSGSVGGDFGVGLPNPAAKMQVVGAAQVSGTGTVGCTAATDVTLTGAGTKFTSEVVAGDIIVANGLTRTVVSVTNDTTLAVARAWGATFTSQSFTVQKPVARFTTATNGESVVVDALGTLVAKNEIQFGNSLLRNGQGGSIELGAGNFLLNSPNATPFIDFHYGTAAGQDFNVRLINDADGQLSAYGNLFYVGGNTTVSGNLTAGAGTVSAYNIGGEGGAIKLAGANGTNIFLEGINGTFRLMNHPWNASLFSVDQSGNGLFAGSVSVTGVGNFNGIVNNGGLSTGNISINGGIRGTNSAGNLHIDSDKTKGDGRIYLNWADGKGVAFGNGANGVVGSVDTAGNASFNGSVSSGGVTTTGAMSAGSVSSTGAVSAGSVSTTGAMTAGTLTVNSGWNPAQAITINSNDIFKSSPAADPNIYMQWSNPGGGVQIGGQTGATNNLAVIGGATVRDTLTANAVTAAGAVTAGSVSSTGSMTADGGKGVLYFQPGEGEVLRLTDSAGTKVHLEAVAGRLRMVDSGWIKEVFSVDQAGSAYLAGNGNIAGNVNVTGGVSANGRFTANGGGIWGTNGAGNLHIDSDKTKADGRIYLNYYDGRGVYFGNGAGTAAVAGVDTAGVAWFNGGVSAGGFTTAGTVTATGALTAGTVTSNKGVYATTQVYGRGGTSVYSASNAGCGATGGLTANSTCATTVCAGGPGWNIYNTCAGACTAPAAVTCSNTLLGYLVTPW